MVPIMHFLRAGKTYLVPNACGSSLHDCKLRNLNLVRPSFIGVLKLKTKYIFTEKRKNVMMTNAMDRGDEIPWP